MHRLYAPLFLLLFMLMLSDPASGQAFRYGMLDWTSIDNQTVKFRIELELEAFPQNALPAVGDVVDVRGGGLRFGDGERENYSITVTSVDVAQRRYTGTATLTHTYDGSGIHTATEEICCRVPGVKNVYGFTFVNLPARALLTSRVWVGNDIGRNNSPRFNMPRVIELPIGSSTGTVPVTIPLVASDADGDALRFRAAVAPRELTGTWTSTPRVTESGALTLDLLDPQIGQLYAVTAIVEDMAHRGLPKSSSQIDFLLKVVASPNTAQLPIEFSLSPAPTVDDLYVVKAYNDLQFSITAATAGLSPPLSINSNFSERSATFTPALPTPSANPATTELEWKTRDFHAGMQEVQFTASGNQVTADTTVRILVNSPPEFSYIPDVLIDDYINPSDFNTSVIVRDDDLGFGDSISITAVQLPSWMSFTDVGDGVGRLSGRFTADRFGTYEITLEARDRYSGTYPGGEPVRVTFDFFVNVRPECMLRKDTLIVQNESCPGSADGTIEARVSGLNGTAYYLLYDADTDDLLQDELSNDTSYTFTGIAAGSYYVKVNDQSIDGDYCYIELDAEVGSSGTLLVFYRDQDGDGFGDSGMLRLGCSIPSGYVDNAFDCDDNNAQAFPGQTWYLDRDRDGYPEASITDCERPFGTFLASELSSTEIDNCPTTPNHDQVDTDGNGVGDACDTTDQNTLTAFSLEAECATVGSNWTLEPNADASNGTFAYAPDQRFTTSPPADVTDNLLRFTVDRATAGSYYLHLRALTIPGDGDSFWIRFNGGNWIKWNEIDCDNAFSWAILPETLTLAAGTNTLDFAFREGKTILDKVFITTAATRPTDFGEAANNCSVLANQAPTAIASAPVLRGTAPFMANLDGSASYDLDGSIDRYDWTWHGGSASGATPTATFAAGTYLVKLKVTDNEGATNVTTLKVEVLAADTQTDSPPFAFEAECAARDRNWLPYGSWEASNGKFVSFTGCLCTGEPTMQNADRHLNYDFVTTQEDTFYLFLRLDAPDVGRNSFWVRVDQGSWIKMWRETDGRQLLTSGFEWRRVSDDARPVSLVLPPGKHTITIAPREPGTKLDKVIVSISDALPTGMGVSAQNCAISKSLTLAGAAAEVLHTYDDALFTAAGTTIFPNPATDRLAVALNDGYTGEVAITVIDAMGRRLRQSRHAKQDRQLRAELPVADLPPGIYHLQIVQDDCQSVERFVKR